MPAKATEAAAITRLALPAAIAGPVAAIAETAGGRQAKKAFCATKRTPTLVEGSARAAEARRYAGRSATGFAESSRDGRAPREALTSHGRRAAANV